MTFIVKYRGGRVPMVSEYECPVHGRFEELVERDDNGDPPATVRCNTKTGNVFKGELFSQPGELYDVVCGEIAEYRISAPMGKVRSVEAVKGGWSKPERPTYTDTRNIGEGQPVYEWREDRARVWEEKRKADVVKFAREHHESVIGGD